MHLSNISFSGPVVLGTSGFLVIVACVMTLEARDNAAKIVPATAPGDKVQELGQPDGPEGPGHRGRPHRVLQHPQPAGQLAAQSGEREEVQLGLLQWRPGHPVLGPSQAGQNQFLRGREPGGPVGPAQVSLCPLHPVTAEPGRGGQLL